MFPLLWSAEVMVSRRSKALIIRDLLRVLEKPTRKTHILYRANLTVAERKEMFGILESEGMIEKTLGDYYKMTAKGKGFLEKLEDVVLVTDKRFLEELTAAESA